VTLTEAHTEIASLSKARMPTGPYLSYYTNRAQEGETKRERERERERACALEEFKCVQWLEGIHCRLKHSKTRHKHMLLLFSEAVTPSPNAKAPHATEALNYM
jgi:hypothetical protein